MRTEQLTTYNEGCNTECTDVQAAGHNSPGSTVSNHSVHLFNTTTDVADTDAKLTRYSDAVAIRTDTAELIPGDAVTLWWVVFNDPEVCAGSCAGSDLSNPEVGGSIMFADGAIVGEDGTATFTASLSEGDVSGVDAAHAGLPGAGTGLADASKAEVHIVMRTHGAALPEGDPMQTEQLTTFNGGCNTECSHVQAAAFNSPNPIILGDANGDGVFDSSDLVRVFEAGKYKDGVPNNATFDEGDWNQDGDFDEQDIVAAFIAGHYKADVEPGASALAAAVDAAHADDDANLAFMA